MSDPSRVEVFLDHYTNSTQLRFDIFTSPAMVDQCFLQEDAYVVTSIVSAIFRCCRKTAIPSLSGEVVTPFKRKSKVFSPKSFFLISGLRG